jgi:hypothetical protein
VGIAKSHLSRFVTICQTRATRVLNVLLLGSAPSHVVAALWKSRLGPGRARDETIALDRAMSHCSFSRGERQVARSYPGAAVPDRASIKIRTWDEATKRARLHADGRGRSFPEISHGNSIGNYCIFASALVRTSASVDVDCVSASDLKRIPNHIRLRSCPHRIFRRPKPSNRRVNSVR